MRLEMFRDSLNMGGIWVVILLLSINSHPNEGQVFTDSSAGSALNSRLSSQQLKLSGSSSLISTEDEGDGPSDPEIAAARERCSFPVRWEGNWFQSGYHQTISITRHSINFKGKCLEAEGDKFIVYNERDKCYRCVVFHEKHQNVLQYKETFCIPERRSLRSMCLTITGDANLFSMFRVGAAPMECPFRGPMTFSYDRGHGECRSPLSNLESCLHSSHLLLNYQACPDVPGTESTVEELECLATWKEGSSRYLLALIQYSHPASLEDRFRCFIYEKIRKERSGFPGISFLPPNVDHHGNNSEVLFRVSQSGDATCNGLTPQEGSRVLTLRRAPKPKTCQFPSWLQTRKLWYSLDKRTSYIFENHELRISNVSEGGSLESLAMTAVCTQIQDNPTLDKVLLVLHTTSGCRSGFICTAIHKRDVHIVELQIGNIARRLDDACHQSYFESHTKPFITLISSSETRQCPNVGKYQVTGLVWNGVPHLHHPGAATTTTITSATCSKKIQFLGMGCNSLSSLQFESECLSKAGVATGYLCHGWWEENGVKYLVVSSASTPAQRLCLTFREDQYSMQGKSEKFQQTPVMFFDEDSLSNGESPENTLDFGRLFHFSGMTDGCHRNIKLGVEGDFAFNVTSQGRCNGINTAVTLSQGNMSTVILVVFTTLQLLLLFLNN